MNIIEALNEKYNNPEELAGTLSAKSKHVNRIGFIGLGAMGFGMARHLLESSFCVLGYDVSLHLKYMSLQRKQALVYNFRPIGYSHKFRA